MEMSLLFCHKNNGPKLLVLDMDLTFLEWEIVNCFFRGLTSSPQLGWKDILIHLILPTHCVTNMVCHSALLPYSETGGDRRRTYLECFACVLLTAIRISD